MDNKCKNVHILVTGATGFLGHITMVEMLRLLPASTTFTCIVRNASYLPSSNRIIAVVSDVCDVERYSGALVQADYVLWMAANRNHSATQEQLQATNVDSVRAALSVLRGSERLQRFLYVSSVSAVDHAEPRIVPLKDSAIPAPRTEYGRSKLRAEAEVRTSGVPWTVLRLPFLYGPGFTRASYLAWYRNVSGSRVLRAFPYPAQISLLYTGDFASIVIAVFGRQGRSAADQSPYFVSDGNNYKVVDILDAVHLVTGKMRAKLQLWKCFTALIYGISSFRSYLYWRHALWSRYFFCVDSERFRRQFPEVSYRSLQDGLRESYTARSYGRLADRGVLGGGARQTTSSVKEPSGL